MKRMYTLFTCLIFIVAWNNSEGQITAEFTSNVNSGCSSVQVSFTDLSTSANPIASWSWDLGGVASNSQNPGRIFGTPGLYTICLTITDTEGNTDTECKNDFIQVYNLPDPDFIAIPQQGCSPLDVVFEDESVSLDGDIIEWVWGVGGSAGVIVDDGSLPEIASTYETPDDYTISLTVYDDNGCTNTITKTDFVAVYENPVVDVSANPTFQCSAPFVVNFTNHSQTTDMVFIWDFGNGTTFQGESPPPIVYNNQGTYTVTVVGHNLVSGCRDTLVLPDYILVGHPIDFSFDTDEGCEDLTVNFTDNSTDMAESVSWDFGDGNSSTASNPSHTYTDPGCYTVSLTRTVNGCVASETAQTCITVFQEPQVSYSNNNPIGCSLPHDVQFMGSSSNAISYDWDFGDGNSSNLQNPQHSYTSYGTYVVTLTVTNPNGCTNSIATDTILVQALQASIPGGQTEGCTPLDVPLTDNSNSIVPITNWEWEVSNVTTSPPASFSSVQPNPTFTLVDTGYYNVRLIVTNAIGCVDTSTFEQVIAVGMPPVIGFDADPKINCVESEITFTDQSSSFANSFLWEFGDGGTSANRNPVYEYSDTGHFDVTLTAWHHGCINFFTAEDFIQIDPPKAAFDIIRDCSTPYLIELVDNSAGADSISWDFGVAELEDDTSSMGNPIYSYPNTGTFTITQEVFNFTTGCSDDASRTITITDPLALFTVTPTSGCAPLTVAVADSSLYANEWSWIAPGGAVSNNAISQPDIIFNNPGIFSDIRLVITDVNGCQDTLSYLDSIYVSGVNPDFTFDPSGGCRPLPVEMTDQSTTFLGNITNWDWDFEGLGTSTDQNANFDFDTIGSWDISLTVTNDWGCSGTNTVTDAVLVTYPYPAFSADTISCTKNAVTFSNQSVGHTLTYLWDFGDGNTSAQANPTHLYVNEGTYSVCLTATDIHGCDSTFCRTDYIVIADPVAAFTADTTFAFCPSLLVNFENQSLNANSFNWEFGDNSGNSALVNPPHLYSEPGSYDVTLIASSIASCADTLVISDYINIDGPVGSFSFDIDSACVPATITFFGESVDNYNFIWDFGNGVLDSTLNVTTDTFAFTYNESGKYVPSLTLVDDANCARNFESPDSIYLEALELDFQATDSVICSGESSTTFLNVSNSTTPITSLSWNFSGGAPSSSTFFEPTVTYNNNGFYDVMLTADNGFCLDTLIKENYISVGESPTADFLISDDLGCAPHPVSFTDLSSISNDVITQWNWSYADGGTSNQQNPDHLFEDQGVQTVQLVVSTDIGCQDTAVQVIEVLPLPVVSIQEPEELCIGETTQLNATIVSGTSGVNYHWLNDPTLSCTDCFDPVVDPLDTTTYYFVVNTAECTDTHAITVNVRPYPIPVITITADTVICVNTEVQLFVNGGPDIYTYQWDSNSPGLNCYNNCPDPIASPETATTYVVTVTNQWECSSTGEVSVDLLDEYQPFLGEDKTICEWDSYQLDASYGNNPIWLVTDGLSCTNCPDPIAAPLETTEYLVSVTTDYGCEVIDTITINIVHEEDVDAGVGELICRGQSVQLNAMGEGQVVWDANSSLSALNILNPIATPAETTTYFMTVTNGDCIMRDTVTIEVIGKADIDVDDLTVCEGESVQLEAFGVADNYTWLMDPGLSDYNIPNPFAHPEETTTYTVIGDRGICEADTAYATVTVIPAPEVSLPLAYHFFAGQTVYLEATTDGLGNYSYEWSPNDLLSCNNCTDPVLVPDTTMTYTISVTDPATLCVGKDSTLVQQMFSCPPELVGVPNIFTPNNDGINDILKLELSPSLRSSGIYSFRIFDRWGAMLFQTNDYNEGWDGTYKGKRLPAGVYIYFIEAPCEYTGRNFIKKGDITIVR